MQWVKRIVLASTSAPRWHQRLRGLIRIFAQHRTLAFFVVVLHHDNFPHARFSPHSSATARATTVNCRSVSLLFLPAAFHFFHNLHSVSIIRLVLPDTLLQAEKRALAMSNDGSGDHVKAALDIYDKDALMLVRPSHLTPLPFLSFSLFSSPSRALFSYVCSRSSPSRCMLRCVSFLIFLHCFSCFFAASSEMRFSLSSVLTFAQGQLPWKETLDVTLPHSGRTYLQHSARVVACAISRLKCVLRAAANRCSPQLRPPSMMRRMISKGKCRFMQRA